MLAVSSPFAELEDQRLADLAKSLAHPARIRILRLLLATPGCIGGDIVDAVGLAQSCAINCVRASAHPEIRRGDHRRNLWSPRVLCAEPRGIVYAGGIRRIAPTAIQ